MNSPLSGRRVLVVEDEMIVAWLLEDMLAEWGYVVIGPAASVNQALGMIEAEAIDAAVLDVNLNGEMSYPVADTLAAREVPFVFTTGYAKDGVLGRYQTVPILQKPYHRSAFCDAVAKLLTPKISKDELVVATVGEESLITLV